MPSDTPLSTTQSHTIPRNTSVLDLAKEINEIKFYVAKSMQYFGNVLNEMNERLRGFESSDVKTRVSSTHQQLQFPLPAVTVSAFHPVSRSVERPEPVVPPRPVSVPQQSSSAPGASSTQRQTKQVQNPLDLEKKAKVLEFRKKVSEIP